MLVKSQNFDMLHYYLQTSTSGLAFNNLDTAYNLLQLNGFWFLSKELKGTLAITDE